MFEKDLEHLAHSKYSINDVSYDYCYIIHIIHTNIYSIVLLLINK